MTTEKVETTKKVDETGTKTDPVKSPAPLNTLKDAAGNKTSSAVAAQTPPKDTHPLEKSNVEIKGEILQGDSFKITVTRGNKKLEIPVPMETNRDLVVLDNTFRIISEILKATSNANIDETYAGYIVSN